MFIKMANWSFESYIVQSCAKQATVSLHQEHGAPGYLEVLRHLQVGRQENGEDGDFVAEHGEVKVGYGLARLEDTA